MVEKKQPKKQHTKKQLYHSSVLCSALGPNLNFQKNVLGQTLEYQVKKEISFPCIPIFKNL